MYCTIHPILLLLLLLNKSLPQVLANVASWPTHVQTSSITLIVTDGGGCLWFLTGDGADGRPIAVRPRVARLAGCRLRHPAPVGVVRAAGTADHGGGAARAVASGVAQVAVRDDRLVAAAVRVVDGVLEQGEPVADVALATLALGLGGTPVGAEGPRRARRAVLDPRQVRPDAHNPQLTRRTMFDCT